MHAAWRRAFATSTPPALRVGTVRTTAGPGAQGVPPRRLRRVVQGGATPRAESAPHRSRQAGFAVPDDLRRVRDYSRDGCCDPSRRRWPAPDWTGSTWSTCTTRTTTGSRRSTRQYLHSPTCARRASRAIGVGMNQSPMLARFLRETPVDVVMIAGRYTLLAQDALDGALAAAATEGKSVLPSGLQLRNSVPASTDPARSSTTKTLRLR